MTGPIPKREIVMGVGAFVPTPPAGRTIDEVAGYKDQLASEARLNAHLRRRLEESDKDVAMMDWIGMRCPEITESISGVRLKWWKNGRIFGARGDNLRAAVTAAIAKDA